MWECKETFSDELLGSWLPQNAKYYTRGWYRKERIDKTHLCTKASNPILRIHTWWNLVNDYRSRSLSNASDRIMAITGVAKAFKKYRGSLISPDYGKSHWPTIYVGLYLKVDHTETTRQ